MRSIIFTCTNTINDASTRRRVQRDRSGFLLARSAGADIETGLRFRHWKWNTGGDPYELYFTEPAGWQMADVQFEGGTPIATERQGELVKTGCRSDVSREIVWRARFQQK
jgi:hypothetical protein